MLDFSSFLDFLHCSVGSVLLWARERIGEVLGRGATSSRDGDDARVESRGGVPRPGHPPVNTAAAGLGLPHQGAEGEGCRGILGCVCGSIYNLDAKVPSC